MYNTTTKKILHFADDEKFIKYAFEAFGKNDDVENHFYIFSSKDDLKYIDFPVKIVTDNFFDKDENIAFIQSFDSVVIHFLHSRYFKLLKAKSFTKQIFWIGWGGDYYWLIDTLPGFEIFKPITRKLVESPLPIPILNLAKRILKRIKRRKNAKLLNRINFFSPVLEVDYHLIKKNYRNFKPKYLSWNYGSLEDNFIQGLENAKVEKNKILIGNSATATNNHLDIFSIINLLELNNLEMIIPLSYGDNNYGKLITDISNKEFSKVYIMKDFLNFEDYQKLLISCGNVFMGHIRQQAMGNIITLLHLGAKIFFFSESVVYQHLKKIGFTVFTFNDILKDPSLINTDLDVTIINEHQFLARKYWGRNVSIVNTRNLLDKI